MDRISKREQLENKNFISKTSGNELSNADEYRQIFNLIDQITINKNVKLNLNHIEGHKPSHKRNDKDKIFSALDIKVRDELRDNVDNNLNKMHNFVDKQN